MNRAPTGYIYVRIFYNLLDHVGNPALGVADVNYSPSAGGVMAHDCVQHDIRSKE